VDTGRSADANSLERHLDVIQEKIERTFNQVNATNALSVQHEELAAQVAQLQRDMELVKDALNIP
jgi:DNA replication protein DnaD